MPKKNRQDPISSIGVRGTRILGRPMQQRLVDPAPEVAGNRSFQNLMGREITANGRDPSVVAEHRLKPFVRRRHGIVERGDRIQIENMDPSRLLAMDASLRLEVSDLINWIAASGGATVADDGDGTVTINGTGNWVFNEELTTANGGLSGTGNRTLTLANGYTSGQVMLFWPFAYPDTHYTETTPASGIITLSSPLPDGRTSLDSNDVFIAHYVKA